MSQLDAHLDSLCCWVFVSHTASSSAKFEDLLCLSGRAPDFVAYFEECHVPFGGPHLLGLLPACRRQYYLIAGQE